MTDGHYDKLENITNRIKAVERMNELNLVRGGAKPLYQQIKERLQQQINEGMYKPHEKLPPERELCKMFEVSRITIRQALEEAIKDGLLYREHGRGTFVADEFNRFEQPLERAQSFEQLLRSKGAQGRTQMLPTDTIWSDFELSSVFQVEVGTPFLQLKLLGFSHDRPIVYYESYFREEVGLQIEKFARELSEKRKPFSSIDLYQRYEGDKPKIVKQSMEARLADDETAMHLRVQSGHPLMKVTSIFLTSTDQPIEFRYAYYLGEKYIFHLTRPLDIEQ